MRVMAQTAMVMNLDKCIGCHTCSVTCKQAWTNRAGVEYVWFNNVETRPGQGYPRRWQDQERWKGGWTLDRRGRLQLKSGGRLKRLISIFGNPQMPTLDDYYEPWTYDYDMLLSAPAQEHTPVARPQSLITGRPMKIEWGSNWDDDLGGAPEHGPSDPVVQKLEETQPLEKRIRMEFEKTFMFYLPRICEHCLNPSCVAACPSGAMYKRSEDGIVLVDQDRCRGWRMCVSNCPYKKVYFNHRTGKAEKCTLCYPRLEVGLPTVCSETCVGRLRYLGVMLYDADKVAAAAATPDPQDLYEAQMDLLLDPNDPEVAAAAARDGIPRDWVEAAQRSPVHALVKDFRVALPLHPEYRTLPMVWYVPPLSPMVDALADAGLDAEHPDVLFAAVGEMRIPAEYLAEILSAGDVELVQGVLAKLAAMRAYMRGDFVETAPEVREALAHKRAAIAARVGMTQDAIRRMYRLLAIAKYDERYVIPLAHVEGGGAVDAAAHLGLEELPGCSVGEPGGSGPPQRRPGEPVPVSIESFHLTKARATAERYTDIDPAVEP
ncbi:nitrate reductase subunit beta [Kineosporia sp. A_224]|uniref:nitrate reductase subunit beta n=1 Tax=Kineosporia sp. A_224 TaxID=1962180 RepID=UPI000B4C081D